MIKLTACGIIATDAEVFEYRGGDGTTRTGIQFGLICEKFYGDENPTFIWCKKYGPDEKLAQHVLKGNQLIVSGTLQSNRNQEGQTFYNVNVDDLEFGRAKKG